VKASIESPLVARAEPLARGVDATAMRARNPARVPSLGGHYEHFARRIERVWIP
jgi:hypothetical protein